MFHYRFVRIYESCNVQTWYTRQGSITFDRFYNLPLMKKFVTIFSRPVRVTKLKPGTYMDQLVDVLCIPVSGPKAHNSWS